MFERLSTTNMVHLLRRTPDATHSFTRRDWTQVRLRLQGEISFLPVSLSSDAAVLYWMSSKRMAVCEDETDAKYQQQMFRFVGSLTVVHEKREGWPSAKQDLIALFNHKDPKYVFRFLHNVMSCMVLPRTPALDWVPGALRTALAGNEKMLYSLSFAVAEYLTASPPAPNASLAGTCLHILNAVPSFQPLLQAQTSLRALGVYLNSVYKCLPLLLEHGPVQEVMQWVGGIVDLVCTEGVPCKHSIELANALYGNPKSVCSVLGVLHLLDNLKASLPCGSFMRTLAASIHDASREGGERFCEHFPSRTRRSVWGTEQEVLRLEEEVLLFCSRTQSSKMWNRLSNDEWHHHDDETLRSHISRCIDEYILICERAQTMEDLYRLETKYPVLLTSLYTMTKARLLAKHDDEAATCPITQEVISNPVTVHGTLFEKRAIFKWLHSSTTHPLTRKHVSVEDIVEVYPQ